MKLKYYFLLFLLFFNSIQSEIQSETYLFSDLFKNLEQEKVEALEEVKNFLEIPADTSFLSLEGGLSQANLYLFTMNEKKYVLRFLTLNPILTRKNEIKAQNIAFKLGIAPPCISSDKNSLLMIMPFIEGAAAYTPNFTQLDILGKMLHKLHNFQGDYPVKYTLQQRLSKHYEKAMENNITFPTGFEEEIKIVLKEKTKRKLVPSHGDLNPSNILIKDDFVTIIDWTNATLDDPISDISYFSVLSNLTPAQENHFLAAYFNRKATNDELTALQEEKAKVYLLTATIWLRFSEDSTYMDLPLQEKIALLDSELSSPNLKPASEYLKEGKVVNLKTSKKSEIRSYGLSFYKAYLKEKKTKKI